MKNTAVDKEQTALLIELFKHEFLNDYFLVGGTNLALRFNHRKSIDLDIFSDKPYSFESAEYLKNILKNKFGDRFKTTQISEVGVFGFIDQIKTDFVFSPYRMLKPIIKSGNVRLADLEDIAAMKVNAVSGRGTRKDFYDIFELLHHFSFVELIGFFQKKFKPDNISHHIRSMNYFKDAENVEISGNTVISLKNVSWENVKKFINSNIKQYYNKTKGKKI